MGEFKKFDNNKLRWHLMPEEALAEILKVLEYGAVKYGDFNWTNGTNWTRYQNALERHLKAFKCGVDKDLESGLYEMSHIATNALMLLYFQLNNIGNDDRFKKRGVKMETKEEIKPKKYKVLAREAEPFKFGNADFYVTADYYTSKEDFEQYNFSTFIQLIKESEVEE